MKMAQGSPGLARAAGPAGHAVTYSASNWLGVMMSATGTTLSLYTGRRSWGTYWRAQETKKGTYSHRKRAQWRNAPKAPILWEDLALPPRRAWSRRARPQLTRTRRENSKEGAKTQDHPG